MTRAMTTIEQKLHQLSKLTASDLTAFGVVDPLTRKIHWRPVIGSISKRTEKIRQHIHSGLTGEVLRTGSFLQRRAEQEEWFDSGEAIMLTEKLYQVAVWPFSYSSNQYDAAILIGKRKADKYDDEQLLAAKKLVEQLVLEFEYIQ